MACVHKKELREILEQIEKHAENSYVRQQIGRPDIPVFFVRVLYLMLHAYQLEKEKIALYTIATTLLKMGIDLHETVETSAPEALPGQRKQQVTVLAGDYYSSLFYYLLAKEKETDVIHCLAGAICRINEWKMSLHQMRKAGAPLTAEMVKRIKSISSELIAALADFFHVRKGFAFSWRPVAEELLLYEELLRFPGLSSTEKLFYLEQSRSSLTNLLNGWPDSESKGQLEELAKEVYDSVDRGACLKESGQA
ncbi:MULTISPECIES: heptaprenyl diphosphate synthase component 1 [Thermoactinomyces]|jgi:heptaprenyl diphosphate synthase|uniref:Heptaprenyl diphosphate synthase component 1 n=1 Tax=Thermoactinomyces daqus TaxID=1329516 RepID=A0A7W2AHV5_9BACL|nr:MULTISPECIES: heptaprenyl diphosphate synthase component 1 [Thermoactinomyces]MBA4543136.1 heptaprenyl diphosphate synthase component 1 [Thermoactinomyces daqus]MBH8596629.1 heptaprenyl diphosphate synthase component 1 [Thermoactinomyces sp. CICC 10523]MBH8603391.1 heptaprenyl diphosphate synthase component 1 [Thermoactinomyces sp. CICC 10522]MBH8607842.1 heptaprenyl diphosphate synthase component 1 [Thermoactinomyces sp. CICC 10521]